MRWKIETFVAVGLSLVLLSLLVFSLGAAVGNGLNPYSYEKVLLPTIAMLGNWVAGAGALAAVYAAMWIYRSQVSDDAEGINASLSLALSAAGTHLIMDITSVGRRPATVSAVAIVSTNADRALILEGYTGKLPATISYGEQIQLIYPESYKWQIAHYIAEYCSGRADGLMLNVRTTVRTHVTPVSGPMAAALEALAKKK